MDKNTVSVCLGRVLRRRGLNAGFPIYWWVRYPDGDLSVMKRIIARRMADRRRLVMVCPAWTVNELKHELRNYLGIPLADSPYRVRKIFGSRVWEFKDSSEDSVFIKRIRSEAQAWGWCVVHVLLKDKE